MFLSINPIIFYYKEIKFARILLEKEEKREKKRKKSQIQKKIKKVLTYENHFDILSLVAREKIKNPKEMRYAEVSELADEQD